MASLQRRRFLAGVALGVSQIAGCLNTKPDPAESFPGGMHEKTVRATGENVSFSKRVEENVDYDPESRTVKISDRESISLQRWFQTRCLTISEQSADQAISQRLNDPDNVAVGVSSAIESDRRVISVWRTVYVERDGTIISSPNVTFDELRNNTPREVSGRVEFRKMSHECSVPVYVTDTVIKQT